ncbi:hypothetical protein Efla_006020 [Eimeria flavescens]
MTGLTLRVGFEERSTVTVGDTWRNPQDVRHRAEMEACRHKVIVLPDSIWDDVWDDGEITCVVPPLHHTADCKTSDEERKNARFDVLAQQRAELTVGDTWYEPQDVRHRAEMEACPHNVIVLPDSIRDDVWDDGEITCVVPPLHHTADCKTSDEERKNARFDVLAH